MSWVRLDDGMPDSLKIASLSDAAFRAYVTSICYAARNLTDGFVPARMAKTYTVRAKVLRELVPALWEPVESGYRIHDYLEYNPNREQVMALRAVDRRRAAMNNDPQLTRAIRARDGDRCRYCGQAVNWRDRKSDRGGTYDHVIPLSRGGTETVENLVVSCRHCNFKKGARTPEAAGMTLLKPSQNLAEIKTESRHPDPDPDPDPQIELPGQAAGAREKRLDAIAADFAAFGLVNSGTARAIEESVADFDLDVVDLAVKRARSSGYEGKPPWSYVESILERWKKQGGPDEPKETRNGRTQTTQRAATGRGRSASTSEADMVDEWKRYAAGQD